MIELFAQPFEQREYLPAPARSLHRATGLRPALIAAGTGAVLAAASAPALAQDAQQRAERSIDDRTIIVTARKRAESALEVPVIQTVLTEATIERAAIYDLNDIAQFAPGLLLGQSVLSSGTVASIRGFGTFAINPGVDQSVALVVDGLPMSHSLAFRSGHFDLAQVEVLKGPQALFFGKSSPAGVISLRTADPGDRLEVIARGLYEIEARQKRGELIVSTPVGETAGFRLAGAAWDSDGFFRNKAIPLANTGALAPEKRLGGSEGYQLRGTLTFEPSPAFDARLKANYVKNTYDNAGAIQMSSCPEGNAPSGNGLPVLNPADDCKFDRTIYLVDLDPEAFPAADNRKGGHQFNTQKMLYGTLELNYNPSDALTLTSVTGYFDFKSDLLFNTFQSGFAANAFASSSAYDRDEFTQELRLNSDFEGPLNFTAGGFYQDAKAFVVTNTASNQVLLPFFPPDLGGTIHTLKIESISAFGQLRFRPTEKFEIAIGGRYTDEKRRNTVVNPLTGDQFMIPNPKISSDTFSPEVTLSYFPNNDTTLFASYKKGYKSGSFALGRLATVGGTILDNSFGDEKVEGGEGGVKARLAGGQLNTEFGAYYYKFKGLQFAVTQAIAIAAGLPFTRVLNAGGARIYGAELDVSYNPAPIEGLNLRAAVAWNKSKFTDLQNVPCWGGQTIALGCNQLPRDPNNPTTNFTAQENLAGLPLPRAPEWIVNFGATYEMPLPNGWSLRFSNDNHYASRQLLNIGRRSDFFQDDYFKFDLGVSLSGPDDTWELAVIGKNLGNEITSGLCTSSNFANFFLTANQPTGTNSNAPDGVDEVGCSAAESGRSIILRLTLRPFGR